MEAASHRRLGKCSEYNCISWKYNRNPDSCSALLQFERVVLSYMSIEQPSELSIFIKSSFEEICRIRLIVSSTEIMSYYELCVVVVSHNLFISLSYFVFCSEIISKHLSLNICIFWAAWIYLLQLIIMMADPLASVTVVRTSSDQVTHALSSSNLIHVCRHKKSHHGDAIHFEPVRVTTALDLLPSSLLS